MNLQWARNFTGDIHIVYYDDLVENANRTLRGILQFLEYPVNQVRKPNKIRLWSATDRTQTLCKHNL